MEEVRLAVTRCRRALERLQGVVDRADEVPDVHRTRVRLKMIDVAWELESLTTLTDAVAVTLPNLPR